MRFAAAQPHVFQLASRRRPNWHRPPPDSSAMVIRDEVERSMALGQLRLQSPTRVATAVWAQLSGLVSLRERGDLPEKGAALYERWADSSDLLIAGLAPS